jgi:N-sulfoglucosamine sulfohydrolase
MAKRRRNILLLIADDLGREQVGCYGLSNIKTPNIDRIAASGTRFDKAFASTASCSGSRTVIYTGLHTHETGSYGLTHGRNGFQTSDNIETMPMLLNSQGYKTGIIGKVHVSPARQYEWQERFESESRNVAMIAERAAQFIESANQEDKAFCLTIGYIDPHRMIGTRGGFGNVDVGADDPRLERRTVSPDEVELPPWLSDLPEVRKEFSEYYQSIHRLDQGVGLVLDALQSTGVADETLVVFLSDNGPPFVNSKTTLFEPGVRLPCLMSVPGREPGLSNPNLVSYVDILPTFLDWAGYVRQESLLSSAPKRRGRSLLELVNTSNEQPGWGQVFGSHTFHEITNYWPTRYMRDRRYKYHRNVCWKLDFPFAMDLYASMSWDAMRRTEDGTGRTMVGPRPLQNYIHRPPEELFDLEADPLELKNLAGKVEYQGIVQRMREAVEQWQADTADLWLWRDGVSVTRYVGSGYAREGLCVPDRFNMDVMDPAGRDCGNALEAMSKS